MSDEWANAVSEPRDGKAHLEVVHDKDLGTIAQITHPDGQVFTAADAMLSAAVWGSTSVDVAADGSLSNLQAPASGDDL